MRRLLVAGAALFWVPAQAQVEGLEQGLAAVARNLGADVSGDAVISASFSGLHVDLGKDGGRFRFDLDTSDIGWVNDLNRLDLRISGPIDFGDEDAPATGTDPLAPAYAAELSWSRVNWTVAQSGDAIRYRQEVCDQFKKVAGIRGQCGDIEWDKQASNIPLAGFRGNDVEKQAAQAQVASAYASAWALLGDVQALTCGPKAQVLPADPAIAQVWPPYTAEQFESCIEAPVFSVFKLSAGGGSQEIGEVLVGGVPADRGTVYPWQVSASYGWLLGERASVAASVSWQRSFAEGVARNFCVEGEAQSTCRELREGAGEGITSGAFTLDAGYRLGRGYAIKLVGKHDIETDLTTVSLPLYLAPVSAAGSLDGGVALDWDSEAESARLRFFVGQVFTLAGAP